MNFIGCLISLDMHQVNSVFNKLNQMLDLIFVSSDLNCSVVDCDFPISPPNTHHSALVININIIITHVILIILLSYWIM